MSLARTAGTGVRGVVDAEESCSGESSTQHSVDVIVVARHGLERVQGRVRAVAGPGGWDRDPGGAEMLRSSENGVLARTARLVGCILRPPWCSFFVNGDFTVVESTIAP